SLMFSGKPLLTAGGPARQMPDQRYLMLWGKMIDAEKAMRASKDGGSAALVPSSWQLIARSRSGEERVIAKGVVAFDLPGDGGEIKQPRRGIIRFAKLHVAFAHRVLPAVAPVEFCMGPMRSRGGEKKKRKQVDAVELSIGGQRCSCETASGWENVERNHRKFK